MNVFCKKIVFILQYVFDIIHIVFFNIKVQIAAEEEGEIKGKGKEDVESGPEEEEVPTRGFLKRQANMIVDAKSRSKRGNRKR